MPKSTKSKTGYIITPQLQKIFIWLAFISILLQLCTIAYWMVRQYPDNSNMSAFLIPVTDSLIMPAVLFLSAFYLRPRSQSLRSHIFDSLFLMTIGLLAMGVINQLVMMIQQQFIKAGLSGYWQFVAYDLAGAALAYCAYIFLLIRLKKT